MLTPAYSTLTLAAAKALEGTLKAAPADVLQSTDCTMLTTEALLLLLSLSACLDPSTPSANLSKHDSNSRHTSQQLPPGSSLATSQQLQNGLDAICSAAGRLLPRCAPELKEHLGSALMLAALPAMQAVPAGRLL